MTTPFGTGLFTPRPVRSKLALASLTWLALSVGAGFGVCAQGQEVVKIGHVGPLSGPIAHLGKDNENGAR